MNTKLTATDLIRLSIEIEHEITPDGDLVPLPGKDPVLLMVFRYRGGYVTYYRRQVPAALRAQIAALGVERIHGDRSAVQNILADYTPCSRTVAGIGCIFDRMPTADEYPDVIYDGASYAITVDGYPVSRAWTQDGNDRAAELAVETQPGFRGRGYARQVAAAWAADVIRDGRVAFYSYLVGNTGSAALARSLGVVTYAKWVSYMRCRRRQSSRERVAGPALDAHLSHELEALLGIS